MKIPHSALPAIRTTILLAFTAASAFVFLFFWTSVGGYVPGYTQEQYTTAFHVDKVNNLVPQSDVTLNGVKVGKVLTVEATPEGRAEVVLNMTDENAIPLHEGVTGRINSKTLVEETYVSLVDGRGTELPDGSRLPDGAVQSAVLLDDLIRTLPEDRRVALASTLQSLGAATKDSQAGVDGALAGLGRLGREGGTALDALAAQSKDLEQLSQNTAAVLAALDIQRGRIADLVTDANLVTEVTANSRTDLENTIRELPPTLKAADDASDDLSRLAGGLGPVAANLDRAAPALGAALNELPATTRDLRGLLPSLDATLGKAPVTLDKVPQFSDDLRALLPEADRALLQLNPMLEYLKPYGGDIYQFFTNFGETVSRGDANGTLLRVMLVFHAQSFAGNPVPLNEIPPLDDNNPYPRPGTQNSPEDDAPPPQVADPGPADRSPPPGPAPTVGPQPEGDAARGSRPAPEPEPSGGGLFGLGG
ncbi:MlaD family protein [Pseudonocardia sp. ICBG1034]|uniref:MlaD family protein n=1 Tax=Pseudonocardia sp. ICBG1034 TaxID=2844381 RepID=UPI001CCBD03C|nr:MlaD family protein [Pseudonocardia sp. ICBG1034]